MSAWNEDTRKDLIEFIEWAANMISIGDYAKWGRAANAALGELDSHEHPASPHDPNTCPLADCPDCLKAAQPDEIGSAGTGGVTLAQMAENIKHGLDPYTGDVPQAAQPDEAQPDANRLRSLLRSCFLDEHHASKALYDEIRKVVNAHETTAEQR